MSTYLGSSFIAVDWETGHFAWNFYIVMGESIGKLHIIVKKFTNSQEKLGLTDMFYAKSVHIGPPIVHPYPIELGIQSCTQTSRRVCQQNT